MPSGGNGPQPSPSTPPSTTCNSATANSVTEGAAMLPAPRITDARVFTSQTNTEPRKATLP